MKVAVAGDCVNAASFSLDDEHVIYAQGLGQRQLQPGNQLAEHQPRSNASDDSNHPVDARGLIGVA